MKIFPKQVVEIFENGQLPSGYIQMPPGTQTDHFVSV